MNAKRLRGGEVFSDFQCVSILPRIGLFIDYYAPVRTDTHPIVLNRWINGPDRTDTFLREPVHLYAQDAPDRTDQTQPFTNRCTQSELTGRNKKWPTLSAKCAIKAPQCTTAHATRARARARVRCTIGCTTTLDHYLITHEVFILIYHSSFSQLSNVGQNPQRGKQAF